MFRVLMHCTRLVLLALAIVGAWEARASNCQNGNQILAIGLEPGQADVIVKNHNKYRRMIALGEVSGQPEGTNLLKMVYDNLLGEKARRVSLQCEMKHLSISDDRWYNVGQNFYMEMSSELDINQNWTEAIAAWFNENEDFVYGGGFSYDTGHYTQVIWAETNHVGCDFIMFQDKNDDSLPYKKIYTCNYGPGGNVGDNNPYKTEGPNTCRNLC